VAVEFVETIGFVMIDFFIAMSVFGFFRKRWKNDIENLRLEINKLQNPEQYQTCPRCGLGLSEHTIQMAKNCKILDMLLKSEKGLKYGRNKNKLG